MSGFRRSTGSSSFFDPDDTGKNLRWLEAVLQDDRAWLDGVEAKVSIDAQTEIGKKELKEWAYDAEDVLDEWKFEQLRAAVEPPPAPIFGRRYSRDPVADILEDPSFRRRVNDLKQRREEIGEFNRTLRLGTAQGPRRYGRHVQPPPSSSLLDEGVIYGREDDKKLLVDFLLNKAMEERLNVVPIVGGPGVGKTTLAQQIYNDAKVYQHFSRRGWVSVSKNLQMMGLMRGIVESLTSGPCHYTQLEGVQSLLKQSICGGRFLLVLDDVWYETVNRDPWEMLRATLDGCADGCVIILTTQDERVASRTETVPSYILESLSGDVCWSVFREHAFGGRLPTDPRLVEIGKKIAKEAQGSPLVAKALGVRLRHEHDADAWEDFLQRDMWDEVVPELKLSYHRLPARLKQCFVYCSMFPKGYLFNREELVRLWMAQGFIEEERVRSLEDTGHKYFDDLLIMSFFLKSQLDTGAFVMPNLLRALAQSISDGECLTVEGSNQGGLQRSDLQKLRHLSFTSSNSELITEFLSFATHLWSFLVVPVWRLKNIAHISLSDEAFHGLNRLRVLDVRQTDIVDLPHTIGNLKHLRYLNLSGTKIKNMHASVFRLYNLQTLDLSCTAITELPDAIGNLSNLLHLLLNGTRIRKLPQTIGNLSKLLILNLGVTKIEELPKTIRSLKGLKFLCLNVSKIQRLPESMCELSNLQKLELEGAEDKESSNHVMLMDGNSEEQLNEHRDQSVPYQGVSDTPDSNVKYLTSRRIKHIHDQGSSSNVAVVVKDVKLLMWMGHPSLSKLTYVVLKNCMMCKTLPQLGQLPLLKELDIDDMSVECVGWSFCGNGDKNGFASLEKLSFRNMYKWQEWDGVEEDDFPCLDELILYNCPKLKGLPCFHSPLTTLKVERCAVSTICALSNGPPTGSLEELELCPCDNLSKLPSLNYLHNLTLMYCENLRFLPLVPSLEKLWIEECDKLSHLLSKKEKLSLPSNLEICSLSSTAFLAIPKAEHVDS